MLQLTTIVVVSLLLATANGLGLTAPLISGLLRKMLNMKDRQSSAKMMLGNPALLITPEGLAARLKKSATNLIILEIVSPKDGSGSPRIPHSQRVWRPMYQQPISKSQPLDGLAPTREEFEIFARAMGVNESTEIVILSRKYDETRLWWLFTAFGKRGVHVLDGGYHAWVAAGLPMSLAEPEQCEPGTWTPKPLDERLLATLPDVATLRGRGGYSEASAASHGNKPGKPVKEAAAATAAAGRLWDVRTPAEYSGEITMPGASQPGRIPWASKRIDWDCFRREDGTWHEPTEIRAIAERVLGGAAPGDGLGDHIFYCQSGVRTTQLIFGMCRAGWSLESLKNYDGSWVEWSHAAGAGDVRMGPERGGPRIP